MTKIMRCCTVCRKRAEKHMLLRFVRALDGEIRFDEKGSLENRGAYVCSTMRCLTIALSKPVLFKKARVLPLDMDVMVSDIRLRLQKGVLSRLGLLRRMGNLEAGRDAAAKAAMHNKAHLIILAQDLSERSVKEVTDKMVPLETTIFPTNFSMDEISQAIGRKKTGVVALAKSRITDEVMLSLGKIKGIAP